MAKYIRQFVSLGIELRDGRVGKLLVAQRLNRPRPVTLHDDVTDTSFCGIREMEQPEATSIGRIKIGEAHLEDRQTVDRDGGLATVKRQPQVIPCLRLQRQFRDKLVSRQELVTGFHLRRVEIAVGNPVQPDSIRADEERKTVQSGMCFNAAWFIEKVERNGTVFDERPEVGQQPLSI